MYLKPPLTLRLATNPPVFPNDNPRFVPMAPPDSTGVSNPKCYARALGSCCETISKEHYISNSLLDQMRVLLVSGPYWHRDGTQREYTSSNLVAKILCRTHNSALGHLDDATSHAFRAVAASLDPRNSQPTQTPIDGEALQRWMLKSLCGLMAAGVLDSERMRGWTPPRHWLEILFGVHPFPQSWGLHFVLPDQAPSGAIRSLEMSPILHPDDAARVVGMDGHFLQIPFRLVMAKPSDSWDLPRAVRRPAGFVISMSGRESWVPIRWCSPPDPPLQLDLGATATEPHPTSA